MPLALASTGTKTLPDVSVTHSLLQMVIALVVVVGCIWGLGKILARLRPGGGPPKRRSAGSRRQPAGNGLSVVSRQSLGKDLSIATVQWGDREVLVGIAGSTITFLNDARPDETAPAASDGAKPWLGASTGPWDPPGDPLADHLLAGHLVAVPRPLAPVATRRTRDAGLTAPRRQASMLEALRNATQRR